MFKTLSLFCFVMATNICAFSQQNRIDSLLNDFKGFMFAYKIQPAKLALETYDKDAIPKIIPLLYSSEFTKIDDKPYLMYPASREYMSTHGYILPYNIDWLSIRAGWLIEALTFIDFGYKTELDEKKYAIIDGYLYKGIREIPWINAPTEASLLKTRKPMADKVAAWWQKNKDTWTRLGALKELLQSKNVDDVYKALHFILYTRTKCDGFTRDAYEKEIKPIIVSIFENTNDDAIISIVTTLLQNGPSRNLIPLMQEASKAPQELELGLTPNSTNRKNGVFKFNLPVAKPKNN